MRQARLLDRLHARLASRAPAVGGFTRPSEPRSIGRFGVGRQLCAGTFLLGGTLIEAPDKPIWDLVPESDPVAASLHGFLWLDDLAAVADRTARLRAQDWLGLWIDRYGRGTGPGWSPGLVGRRLMRWVNHAGLFLPGWDEGRAAAFRSQLARHAAFLARRWKSAPPGRDRFEALTGLILAGLSLEGLSDRLPPALHGLAQECIREIGGDGSIATRNPEDLLEILTLLIWTSEALVAGDSPVPEAVAAAIARVAPTLRHLRHADGGLARFHGGGRGLDGRLDHALAVSGLRAGRGRDLAMGYARLAAGRTSVIVDAAPPPSGPASGQAHASTLAFELTSGRRPVIVNCGSGDAFGEEWRRAGRATPSHSTLSLEGHSSARIAAHGRAGVGGLLIDGPREVPAEWSETAEGLRLSLAHDGWRRSHGLTHVRSLDLQWDGRGLAGEDMLMTVDDADRQAFDRIMEAADLKGLAFALRFHLHPEVDVALGLGGSAVSLTPRSGEVWVLRHDGTATLSLEPSVYLERGRRRPRPTQQVVLSARAMSYATRIRWTLTKAHETPDALRDYGPPPGEGVED